MNREEILDAAKRCVCGDREQDYCGANMDLEADGE